MTSILRRANLPLILLATCLSALAIPALASAALKPVSGLKATDSSVSSVTLEWKDRSKGETSYVATLTGEGGHTQTTKANRDSIEVKKLATGTLYQAQVQACKGSSCADAGRTISVSTLLAPFNGPHPDTNCATFPASDAFNEDISSAPVDPRSDAIIGQINKDGDDFIHPDFGRNPHYGIPYTVVPADQPLVPIKFGAIRDESDPGPYPIAPGSPIEGDGQNGDRHVITVQQPAEPGGSCKLFELYHGAPKGGGWKAASGAIFDLGSALVGQRPDGWTSADAGGLPIFPGLVTYEDAQDGSINHAIRITFDETRRGYISPASHYASDSCNPNRPPMGMRLRLKSSYDTSKLNGSALVIATAMQKYGVINADNGSNWYISGTSDRRWDNDNLNELKDIPGTAFEVVQSGSETSPC